MIKVDIDCHNSVKYDKDNKVIFHHFSTFLELEDKISLINSERIIFKDETEGHELHHIFFSDKFVSKLKDEIIKYKEHQDENYEKFLKLEQENERMQKLISYYENLNLLLE